MQSRTQAPASGALPLLAGSASEQRDPLEARKLRAHDADAEFIILDSVCIRRDRSAQAEAGDCDANGAFNILDFVCFQQLFQAGCP